jgi:hypothetical protein
MVNKLESDVPEIEKEKCTCPFSKYTAREIGHFKGCPCYGELTWWQEKEKRESCEICGGNCKSFNYEEFKKAADELHKVFTDRKSESLEEEFDELWRDFEIYNCYQYPEQKKNIKQFISQQIHQAQVDILRDVLPEKRNNFLTSEYDMGHNFVRHQILSKAKELGISEEELK